MKTIKDRLLKKEGKNLKIPIRSGRLNTRLASQEKFDEREAWHKLVVKVIIWKDRNLGDGANKLAEKITQKEWKTYCRRIVKTNIVYGKAKVSTNLKQTWQVINDNNGFEEEKSL